MRYIFRHLTTPELRAIKQILENEGIAVPVDILAELERRGDIVEDVK